MTVPFERGTEVRYNGSLWKLAGDILVVLGPCDCNRCPCTEPSCDQHHYLLADPWDDPDADPLTLPPKLIHARHSSLEPYVPQELTS
jgi:hypothetical protein